MDAMIYEAIIRFANNDCGRYGTAGANADIYRHLMLSEALYREAQEANERKTHNNLGEATLNFGIALGEITAYLADATERIRRNYASRLTEEQKHLLSNGILVSPTLESVNQAIENVSSLIPILRE